jgi:hypothetical protein
MNGLDSQMRRAGRPDRPRWSFMPRMMRVNTHLRETTPVHILTNAAVLHSARAGDFRVLWIIVLVGLVLLMVAASKAPRPASTVLSILLVTAIAAWVLLAIAIAALTSLGSAWFS